jgi:hypothetical protein
MSAQALPSVKKLIGILKLALSNNFRAVTDPDVTIVRR